MKLNDEEIEITKNESKILNILIEEKRMYSVRNEIMDTVMAI